jgi:signal peptidase I
VSATLEAKQLEFGDRVVGVLTEGERQALKRARWVDRLTSPWASVTVLGLVFLVYLAIVETSVCTHLWLQPVMKVIGTMCFFWWAAVMVGTQVLRPWAASKRHRSSLEETLTDVESLATKHWAKLKPEVQEQLVKRCHAAAQALGTGEGLEQAQRDLRQANTTHLAAFRSNSAIEMVGGFGRALLIALLVRSVFLEPYKIPSGSMIPTLELGDQIFVNKFIYGVRLPFTNTVPFVLVREPARGDVIVFENPNDPGLDYIKRVVGVPGDRITIQGKQVTINGKPVPLADTGEVAATWERPTERSLSEWASNPGNWFRDDWRQVSRQMATETLDSTAHRIANDTFEPRFFEGTIEVPPKSVFVMGDSRDNSSDSRYGLGHESMGLTFVPFGNIKGKATVIWLALGHGGLLSNIFGGTGIRTDRFFSPVSVCK